MTIRRVGNLDRLEIGMGTLAAMAMGCAQCGCVVDLGVRVSACTNADCCCRELPLRREQERVNQFALPHGFMGHVVGWVMALGNADMERRAIEALHLHGSESALEIGFGPGVGLRLLARRLPEGFVAGVEPSVVMLAQARRRCRRGIRAGGVDLRRGIASSLPWEDARFDAVCSVNNIQEWSLLEHDFGEIRRVLRPGGHLSIAVHAWVAKDAKDRGDAGRPWAEHLAGTCTRAEFRPVSVQYGRALSGRAVFVLAGRP